DRTPEAIVSMLAVLKAGGAYLPLDPATPPERLHYMMLDSGAVVLLTQKRLNQNLPEQQAQVVFVDEDWKQIALESREDPDPVANPNSLAYVIYTSGSTGQPKGVMVENRAVLRLVLNTDYVTIR